MQVCFITHRLDNQSSHAGHRMGAFELMLFHKRICGFGQALLQAFKVVVAIVVAWCSLTIAGQAEENSEGSGTNLLLTAEERSFLNKLGTIKIQNESDGAPYNFQQGGIAQGYSVEYFELIAEQLGIKVEYVNGPTWSEFLQQMQSGDIDVMLNVGRTPEREEYIQFTDPYLRPEFSYVMRVGDLEKINTLDDLKDKKIAVVRGFWDEQLYKNYYPEIELVYTDSLKDSLIAVSRGKADATLTLVASFNHYIDKHSIPGLGLKHHIETQLLSAKAMHMGVRKELAQLATLISKAMREIPVAKVSALKEKWQAGVVRTNNELGLSSAEVAFLRQLAVVRVHNEIDRPPFNFNRSGLPQGFSVDYVRLLAEKLGIELKFVQGGDWESSPNLLKDGLLDLLLNVGGSLTETNQFIYTDDYMTPLRGFAVKKDAPFTIGNTKDLEGKTIAVVKGSWEESYLKERFPELQLYLADTTLSALRAVSSGYAEVAAGVVATFDHIIDEFFFTRLTTFGDSSTIFSETDPIHLGVRKDWPLLASSLSKAMRSVTPQEFRQIKDKWLLGQEEFTPFVQSLNETEKAFLRTVSVLRVQNDMDWPPYNFNQNGIPQGYSVEFIRLVAAALDIEIEFVQGRSWSTYVQMIEERSLDLLLNASYTPDRLRFLDFTTHYLKANTGMVVRREDLGKFSSVGALEGRTVAILKGSATEEDFRNRYPNLKLVAVNSVPAALQAVASGEADATFAEEGHVRYLIDREFLTGLAVSRVRGQRSSVLADYRIGVRNDWPLMAGILSKAIASLPEQDVASLRDKWGLQEAAFGAQSMQEARAAISLTEEEQSFLRNHPVLRVHNEADWAPYNFNENGIPQGFSIDYMKLLASLINVDVEFIHGPSWSEFLGMIDDKKLDIMLDIYQTPERRSFIEFTRPYDTLRLGLVTRDEDSQIIRRLEDLNGRTLAAMEGFFHAEYFQANQPDVKLLYVKTTQESVQAVIDGRADATLIEPPVLDYLVAAHRLTGLTMNRHVDGPVMRRQALHLGVRKDWPVLARILSKAIDAVPQEEVSRLKTLWLGEAEDDSLAIELSPEERAFLADHPIIRISNLPSFFPYDFNEQGVPKGYSVDIANLIAQRLGVELQFVSGHSWEETLAMAYGRELDVTTSIWEFPSRKDRLLFTDAYTPPLTYVLAVRDDEKSIRSLTNLKGRKLAVVPNDDGNLDGDGPHQFAFAKADGAIAVKVANRIEGLRAVSIGEADAYYGSIGEINYLVQRNFLGNLKLVGTLDEEFQQPPFKLAVRDDWPIFQGILNKALASLTTDEMNEIRNRWLGDINSPSEEVVRIALSPEEREFLSARSPLKVCAAPGYMPIEDIDSEGQHTGVIADYTRLIAAKVGTDFELVSLAARREMLEHAKERGCDVLPGAKETALRRDYLDFTSSYFEAPIVLVTRETELMISSLDGVIGQSIAVLRGHVLLEELARDFPAKEFVLVDSVEEGLRRVSSGELYGLIGSMINVTHQINDTRLSNLKITGHTRYKQTFAVATRNDWPALSTIFEKAVTSITEEEHQQIFSRWNRVRVDQSVDTTVIWQIVGGASVVLLVVFLWNRKLQRLNNELEETQSKLERTLLEQSAILENAAAGIAFIKDRVILRCNRKWEEIVGYEPGELTGVRTDVIFPSRQAFEDFGKRAASTILEGGVYVEDIEVVRKDGAHVWVTSHGAAVVRGDPDQGVIWVSVDITERKHVEASLEETRKQLVVQDKMASLGTLTAGVAHEINNPANFTNASVHLIHKEADRLLAFLRQLAGGEEADPKAMAAIEAEFSKLHELADTAAEGTRRIKAIVKDLRTFTRLDEAEKSRMPIGDVVGSTVQLVRTKHKEVEFVTELTDNPQLECYPSKLGQVLMNIVVNACDAIAEQQKQEPSLMGRVKIETHVQNDILALTVSDNGCGMTEEVQAKVFEPFYTTKEVGIGTGLGMAISYSVMEEHGGTMSVDSVSGQGTRFTLNFPL